MSGAAAPADDCVVVCRGMRSPQRPSCYQQSPHSASRRSNCPLTAATTAIVLPLLVYLLVQTPSRCIGGRVEVHPSVGLEAEPTTQSLSDLEHGRNSSITLPLRPSWVFTGKLVDTELQTPVSRVAFGSCAKQSRDQQRIWSSIAEVQPDVFLWTGDAIYAECQAPDCIKRGFDQLTTDESPYAKFAESMGWIDGTWDDHDYGLNDAGAAFPFRRESQQLFLDFLNYKHPVAQARRERSGVYSAVSFPLGNSTDLAARVILLDTRFNRDAPWSPNLGEYNFPFATHASAFLRFAATTFGLHHSFEGDVLGEPQWQWLSNVLATNRRESDNRLIVFNIVVTSFQMFSSLPFLESWGQYPAALDRFVHLVQNLKPSGLMILSGDVHFAQNIGKEDCVVEVTSSGLTHSILNEPVLAAVLTGLLVPKFAAPFETSKKYRTDNDEASDSFSTNDRASVNISSNLHQPVGDSWHDVWRIYEGKNFGVIDFESFIPPPKTDVPNKGPVVRAAVTIRDADGRVKMTANRFVSLINETKAADPQLEDETQEYYPRISHEDNYSCLDRYPRLVKPISAKNKLLAGFKGILGLVLVGGAIVVFFLAVVRAFRTLFRGSQEHHHTTLESCNDSPGPGHPPRPEKNKRQ